MLKDFAQFHVYCFSSKVTDKVCPTCASKKKVYDKVCQKMGRNNLSLLILWIIYITISTSTCQIVCVCECAGFVCSCARKCFDCYSSMCKNMAGRERFSLQKSKLVKDSLP